MRAVGEANTDCRLTGRTEFPQGSYANGGAMRISPVGLAFRNANDTQLLHAARMAVISSHVHNEAVDAAWLQAKVTMKRLCESV